MKSETTLDDVTNNGNNVANIGNIGETMRIGTCNRLTIKR